MEVLTTLTSIVNYIALAITIWLGWYILTHSIHKPISWLTSLTLWSISGIFINSLLAINPPPIPENVPQWIELLFPFWDKDVLTHSATGWISGWMVIPSVGFWHHVTMLVRPERWKAWHYLQVVAVYLVTVAAIIATRYTPYMYEEVSGDVLHLDTLKPGLLFYTFMLLLTIILAMCFLNLRYAIHHAQSSMEIKQLRMLAWATLVAGLTAPVSVLATSTRYHLPIVIDSALLAISVIIIGISVGRYSALIEGRILRRDLIYSGAAMTVVALLYSVIIWISVLMFEVPPAAYIFIIVFAFATHSIVDTARRYLDLFFYRKEERLLRQNIRQLSFRVGDQGLKETLELALDLTCTSVRATFGLMVTFHGDENRLMAAYRWNKDVSKISRNVLTSDDFQQSDPGHLPEPLGEVTLLIPIYLQGQQTGTMLFGPPINSIRYPTTEIDRLLDVSDQIGTTIQQVRQGSQLLEQAVHSIQIPKISSLKTTRDLNVQELENALRNLHDFAFLGDSGLAKSKLVTARLPEHNATHLDRGKIVYTLLEEAVTRLKPNKAYPDDIPTREWYPYLILHYAYFEDKLNRDIMSQLYISEGTFNRTRRSAIRSVTRVLVELEKSVGENRGAR